MPVSAAILAQRSAAAMTAQQRKPGGQGILGTTGGVARLVVMFQ